MNDTKINHLISVTDSVANNLLSPLDDLYIARQYMLRNPHLIKEYPSLEEALKLLNRVIEHEESDRNGLNSLQD